MFYFLSLLLAAVIIFTFWFALSSLREKARRAAGLGLAVALVLAIVLVLYAAAHANGLLSGGSAQTAQLIVGIVAALFLICMFGPIGRRPASLAGTAGMRQGQPERLNQKNTAFNIAHVGGYGPKVGRRRWALLKDDPFGGIFMSLCMGLRPQVDGKVAADKKECSRSEITKDIKSTAQHLGADIVGITTIKEDFVYSDNFSYEDSKVEVGPAVTTPVDLKHKYIIVLGKEMDYDCIQATLTDRNQVSAGEIGRTYYELAKIACGLAAYIRQLGYSARAHHLRNEQVFLVPHAVDAGLGEQGRHNYMISAKHGPRVRLAGVTTSLELDQDRPVDIGVQDFCENCRLCETNCPTQALGPEKKVVRGYKKWPQDQEKCFRFWVSGGNTFACTMCMKACPWNKPQTFVHNVSFFAVSRSVVARRVFYWLAVLFYGKKIEWTRVPLAEGIDEVGAAQSASK